MVTATTNLMHDIWILIIPFIIAMVLILILGFLVLRRFDDYTKR
jgi:predicted permease